MRPMFKLPAKDDVSSGHGDGGGGCVETTASEGARD
jgi:hypothetical protein